MVVTEFFLILVLMIVIIFKIYIGANGSYICGWGRGVESELL